MRNYKKENKWKKKKYETIHASIEKELGTNLKEILKKEHKPIAKWVTESAKLYVSKHKEYLFL